MVANPEKFKSIIITKLRQDTSGINIEFSGNMIKSCTQVKMNFSESALYCSSFIYSFSRLYIVSLVFM